MSHLKVAPAVWLWLVLMRTGCWHFVRHWLEDWTGKCCHHLHKKTKNIVKYKYKYMCYCKYIYNIIIIKLGLIQSEKWRTKWDKWDSIGLLYTFNYLGQHIIIIFLLTINDGQQGHNVHVINCRRRPVITMIWTRFSDSVNQYGNLSFYRVG